MKKPSRSGDTLSVPYVQPLIAPYSATGMSDRYLEDPYVYNFNGTDMYATMGTGWEPLGLPYTIEFKAITDDVTTGAIAVGKDVSQGVGLIFTQGAYTYDGVNTPNTNAATPSLVTNTEYTYVVNATGAGTTVTVITEGAAGEPSKTVGQGDITTIGATGIPNQYWGGPIWNLRLTDGSPLQDRAVVAGDGSLYVALDETFTLTDEWVMECSIIRHDRTGTSDTRFVGGQGSAVNYFAIEDSGSGHALTLTGDGGTRTFANAFADIAQGQHFTLRIEKTKPFDNLYVVKVDDVQVGTSTTATDITYTLENLYTALSATARKPSNGMAIGNLRIEDTTGGRTYQWNLDEGSGTLAEDTGSSGQRFVGPIIGKPFGIASTSGRTTEASYVIKTTTKSRPTGLGVVISNARTGSCTYTAMVSCTETTALDSNANFSKCIVGGVANETLDDPSGVGFQTVTWGGSSSVSLTSTVGNYESVSSDIIPVTAVDRASGEENTEWVIMARIGVTFTSGESSEGNFPIEATVVTDANKGKIWQGGRGGLPAATDPSISITRPTTSVQSASAGLIVRSDTTSMSVLGVGDSTVQGVNQVPDKLSCYGAVASQIASTEAVTVEWQNNGQAGATSSVYTAQMNAALAQFNSNVILYMPWSSNDFSLVADEQDVADQVAAVVDPNLTNILSLARSNRQIVVVSAIPQVAWLSTAAMDAVRKNWNISAKALVDSTPNAHWFDIDAVVSNNASPADFKPEYQWPDSGSADGIHFNADGHNDVGLSLAPLLSNVFVTLANYGTWSADNVRTTIPDNSRYYPMNEGSR